ncbi:hypothetical protein M899_3215 [Bacteriovorax sp. BSW11_IV]|uniref:hypothetical protein n=1 Tax=Bacteriovorax sp. BSW11_IV TaxID=1353529 RepID=UPI00038A0715|nr:hypothetical protein [Bacteriovorax sp. BSW11_IV]EQC48233.1 hypothetical protein M899_3215 [Bacteriovorax sp. BSW11_IV]
MKLIKTLVLMTIFTMTSAHALVCNGEKRVTTPDGVVVQKTLLETIMQGPELSKYALDIDEAYYSVTVHGQDITSMITLGPDYTTGNLSKGSLDKNGNLRLSYVTPYITYILTCSDR